MQQFLGRRSLKLIVKLSPNQKKYYQFCINNLDRYMTITGDIIMAESPLCI